MEENVKNKTGRSKDHSEQESQVNKDMSHLINLFKQTPAAVAIVTGPKQRYIFANPLYEKLFNRSQKELLGNSIREVFPELEGQGVYELFDQVYKTGKDFVAEEYPVFFQRNFSKGF